MQTESPETLGLLRVWVKLVPMLVVLVALWDSLISKCPKFCSPFYHQQPVVNTFLSPRTTPGSLPTLESAEWRNIVHEHADKAVGI
jgi:hypothetical protein